MLSSLIEMEGLKVFEVNFEEDEEASRIEVKESFIIVDSYSNTILENNREGQCFCERVIALTS